MDEAKVRKYVILRSPIAEHEPGDAVYGVFLTDGRFMDIASSDKDDAIAMAEVHYEPHEFVVRPLYAAANIDGASLDHLINRLCSTPLIEDLSVSLSDWESCETVADDYDMTKRKIRAAFAKIRSEP